MALKSVFIVCQFISIGGGPWEVKSGFEVRCNVGTQKKLKNINGNVKFDNYVHFSFSSVLFFSYLFSFSFNLFPSKLG